MQTVDKLSQDYREFLFNPDKDFTRNRKLPFKSLIKFILCMEAGSIKDELYNNFDLNIDNPSASAFVQQRCKIKYQAF